MAINPPDNYIAVNMSGQSFNVYGNHNGNPPIIGTIYPREVFACTGYWEGGDIIFSFRDAQGNWVNGGMIPERLLPYKGAERIDNYALSTNALLYIPGDPNPNNPNGWQAATYKARRQLRYTNQMGDNTRYIPAGSIVYAKATYDARNGDINEHMLQFNAYKDPNGKYVYTDQEWGFVDTGVREGSRWDQIGLYGNW